MPNHPPLGFTFAGVPCGLKKTGAADFALIASDHLPLVADFKLAPRRTP